MHGPSSRSSLARLAALAAALVVSAGSAASVAQAQDRRLLEPHETAAIDRVFASFATGSSPGCAVAVYRGGEIAFGKGYGLASLEHDVPITPRTVFDIGSTAKQFTAFSILLLEREGKLSLDDDVRRFVPDLPRYDRPITLRHLLHHTSGLRDYLTLFSLGGVKVESWTTQQDAVRLVVRQQRANFAAGDDFVYSNTGYLLLAEVVRSASGKPLKDFARERIFEPLGMKDTFILDDHARVVPRRATGYTPRQGGGFRVSMSDFEQVGDGAVQTTVEDLLAWDRNFYQPRVGDAALIERALQGFRLNGGRTLDYGAGLFTGVYRGQPTVRHGGSWAGYRADLLRFPKQQTSIACLCNLGSANPSSLADRVADIVLSGVLAPLTESPARPAVAPAAAAAPHAAVGSPALDGLAGVFKSADGREYRRLEVRDGKGAWSGGLTLSPVAPGRFRLGQSGSEIEFTSTSTGVVECRVIPPPGAPMPPTTYRRLPPPPSPDLAHYAGDYRADELDVAWTFAADSSGSALVFTIRGDVRGRFLPVEPDVFAQENGLVVEFVRKDGRVKGGRLHAGRVRDLEFAR